MSFNVSVNLNSNDPLYEQKKTILESNDIDINKPFEVNEDAPLPNGLISALRVQSLTDAELAGATAVEGGRIEAIRADRQNAFGEENQKHALSSFQDALKNNGSDAITISNASPELLEKTNQEVNKLF